MGLDVTAYGKTRLFGYATNAEWEDKWLSEEWRETVYVWPEYVRADAAFPEQREGSNFLPGGVYGYEERVAFRAGSYSGYNRWRDTLSQLILSVSAKTVWQNRAAYRDRPFYYLIAFSDCEGIIAGNAAQKLKEDFVNFHEAAECYPDEWWVTLYRQWRRAFECAAEGGLVLFR